MPSMEAPQENTQLSESEAQDEANMMTAHMELSGMREATAEDYDAALSAIEELKKYSGDSERGAKMKDVLARLAERSKFAFKFLTSSISTTDFSRSILVNEAVNDHEKAMYQLDSAADKLKKLKEIAGI